MKARVRIVLSLAFGCGLCVLGAGCATSQTGKAFSAASVPQNIPPVVTAPVIPQALNVALPPLKPPDQPKPRLTFDVRYFFDIQFADLDEDGIKEIVALYNSGLGLVGIKAIKWHDDTGSVMFSRVFAAEKGVLEVVDSGLVVRLQSPSMFGFGLKQNQALRWDAAAGDLREVGTLAKE